MIYLSDMGANAELFLHLRDAEVNGGEYQAPSPSYSEIDMVTLYRTAAGKVVKKVGSSGRILFCEYPGNDKSYAFRKSDLSLIWREEEKVEAFKLFKSWK